MSSYGLVRSMKKNVFSVRTVESQRKAVRGYGIDTLIELEVDERITQNTFYVLRQNDTLVAARMDCLAIDNDKHKVLEDLLKRGVTILSLDDAQNPMKDDTAGHFKLSMASALGEYIQSLLAEGIEIEQ